MSKKYHYVYRITNKIENKHYIGVRSCDIEPYLDLGFKYKGTSKDLDFVKDQQNNPQNYIYQILDFFSSREKAIKREMYLHEIYNVDLSESFYNISKQCSTKWDNTGNKKIAKKISKANKNRTVINNGESIKRIKPENIEELNEYLSNGWIKGSLPHSPETCIKISVSGMGKIYMKNGLTEIKINPEEIDKYRVLGFYEGRLHMTDIQKFKLSLSHMGKKLTEKHKENISIGSIGKNKSKSMKDKLSETRTGMVFINNGEIEKIIKPTDLHLYVYDNWKEGKLPMLEETKKAISKSSFGKPGTTTGRIYINKNSVEKVIPKDKLDEHISNGWVKGRLKQSQETKQKLKGRKGSTSGKIGINNKISNKFIFEEELEKYLNEGWLKGLKSTKKDDIWQKKKK